MFKLNPLAGACMAALALPAAVPAMAQTAAAQSTGASAQGQQGQPPGVAQLPAVNVYGLRPEQSGFQSDKSSVGAKVPTDPMDIPQAVVSVNKQLLQSQGATSFQDALRNVPGITIGGAEGGQIGNNINLRGFAARTDIYLDGFRDRGQYYRDTFDLESIDVLYGPSSLYFGRGSTGGVINQVSKQANLKQAASVSATVGTDDHYRASFDVNQPLSDTSAFRLNGFGQDIGSTRDVMKNQDYGFAPTLRLGIGTPTEITLSALIQHNRDQPDYGVPALNGEPAPVDKSKFYGFTDDRTVQDVQTLSARIEHHFDHGITLRNQTQYSHYGTDARESNPASVLTGPSATSEALSNGNYTSLPMSQLYVKLSSKDRTIDDHSFYNSTDVEGKFGQGWLKHDVIAGVDVGHETYSNQSYTSTAPGLPSGTLGIVSLADPAYAGRAAGTTTVAGNRADATADSLGLYLNDTMSLGQHWKLVGGLRWDRYDASTDNSTTSPEHFSQTSTYTSVRGGVIYQPTDWQSYYVSYGTSFDPSLEALTLTRGQTEPLEPATNESFEIGSKWALLGGNLSVTQSLFQINQKNAAIKDVDGNYTAEGKIRVRGYQVGVAGQITKKWQVYGGYTYLDSEIRQAYDGTEGNTVANTPRNTFTLWSTYKVAPHWEIGGGPTYMSSRYAANNDLVTVPGYTRWDAMVAYHAAKYDIRLNALNLTDKRYYDGIIQSDGGRAVPGIGRTFLATLDYRF
ncbi:TonB-dependent receptor [Candidimonas nitroreducens]|uniref:TonB-dependent siderophore receptor n=1 Tax=Candidimonas nitroreducens TaxID=683354 RepID=A0A225MYC3_9BURK|nr:TonB-dependent siderophore receptor [Candidimonas nitroreducens]OWT65513.1 TonB-dependent siderophore receptor [Candidimonas nitroreducens]